MPAPAFEPAFAGYADRVRSSFARQGAMIVDAAGGYAGYTLFPEDSSVLTVEFKLNLLAPAQGDRIVAEGHVVKPGRTLAITRGEVYAERDGARSLIALMQQTLIVMTGKPDA